MTDLNKVNTTLEMLKSCKLYCLDLAAGSHEQQDRQLFDQLASNVKQCEEILKSRVFIVNDYQAQYPDEMFP